MVERTGPRLTITCEGCAFYARVTSDESVRICNHEHTAQPHHRLMTTGAPTPAWCPLLPAARLALARSVVAGDRPERSYQGPMPFVEDEDAPRSRRPSDEEEPSR